jgi:hypothetical protein
LAHSFLISEKQCAEIPNDLKCIGALSKNKGEFMECTCKRNCMPVTVVCGDDGKWEYDKSICTGDNDDPSFHSLSNNVYATSSV